MLSPPHRCNHKENVNGALFVIIKSICFAILLVSQSSASKKDMYLPPALLIPLFLATPVPQFSS
jgi:hypothetical protein